jgi:hypothetical protein
VGIGGGHGRIYVFGLYGGRILIMADTLKKRRIRIGSKEFAAMSQDRKDRLMQGEPLRENGVIIIPVPRGESISAKKRGKKAAAARRARAKEKPPEGAKPRPEKDRERQRDILTKQGDI